MTASALGFSFKVSTGGVNEIFRMTKDGAFEKVETTNKDYPEINPGEKLVMITGLSRPYQIDSRDKNPETGEPEKVTMIKLEFGILDGRQKGARYLMPLTFRVTSGTNLGKILAGIFGEAFDPSGDYPPEMIARKPFYMVTNNERKGDYTNVKFVDARKWDEAVDGPIPGAGNAAPQAAPAPQQANDEAIWNTNL
jgi:hypothetical protein